MPAANSLHAPEPNRSTRRATKSATFDVDILTTNDPDVYRRYVDGARRYAIDGFDPMPSVTSIKPAKAFRSRTPGGQLVGLDALRAAQWVLDNRHHIDDADPDQLVEDIAAAPAAALRQDGDRGTEVHAAIEALILGNPFDVSAEARPFVDAARSFIADYAPRFHATEVIAVIPRLGLAGTIDAIATIGHRTVILDWKTRGGRHGAYPEEIAQLGAYSLADHLIVGDHPGTRVPMPHIDEVAVISLCDDTSYGLYPGDLDLARAAAEAMADAHAAVQALTEAGQQAIGAPLIAAPVHDQTRDPLFQRRLEWIRGRVKALPEAAASQLAAAWPHGVPRRVRDLGSHDEIDQVDAALTRVEGAHSLPFHTGDPRATTE